MTEFTEAIKQAIINTISPEATIVSLIIALQIIVLLFCKRNIKFTIDLIKYH